MCYEFCNQALIKTINCNQVSCDGYEIENLTSNNFIKRNNGFLCATFVKPPIEITIQFLCGVELHFIRLCNRVGSQKSVGFELYSHLNHSGVADDDQFTPDYNYLLGKAFVNNNEDDVCFVNRNFLRKNCTCVLPCMDSSIVVRNVNHHLYKALTNIRGITIRIVRTERGTVPALKKLEIWAEPSRYLCKTALENVNKVISDHKECVGGKSSAKIHSNVNLKTNPEENSVVNEAEIGEDIPSEFLDAITHEIMTLPVLLPSGNCVDQATLDKHSKSEASWGRTPNDPFTGLPFHADLKPVINTSLKSRIDSFLLRHENLAKNLGRTTGRSSGSKSTRPNASCEFTENPTASVLVSKIPRTSSLAYREDKTIADHDGSSKRLKREDVPESGSSACPKATTHQDILRESLNSSLKNVMSNLKSFTKQKPKIESSVLCKRCKVKTSEYRLPCHHVVCKTCLLDLLKQNLASCPECRKPFIRSDPIKIYL